MTDPLEIKRLLKKEVVEFLVKLGGQVDLKAIRKARKHLLQKYNTDHKKNTEATDSHFGIVHEWVRERLVESHVQEYITAVADHAEEAFLLSGNPSVEAALRELQDGASDSDEDCQNDLSETFRTRPVVEKSDCNVSCPQKTLKLKRKHCFDEQNGSSKKKQRRKCAPKDLNRLHKTRASKPAKLKPEEQNANFVDKMELFFATHCPTKDCSRRYALLFRKMLQRRHNGYNLMFPIDDDFVDNLFHFIETLKGNKYRAVDNGFSHSCLTKIRSVGKKAFIKCWNEVRLLIHDM